MSPLPQEELSGDLIAMGMIIRNGEYDWGWSEFADDVFRHLGFRQS